MQSNPSLKASPPMGNWEIEIWEIEIWEIETWGFSHSLCGLGKSQSFSTSISPCPWWAQCLLISYCFFNYGRTQQRLEGSLHRFWKAKRDVLKSADVCIATSALFAVHHMMQSFTESGIILQADAWRSNCSSEVFTGGTSHFLCATTSSFSNIWKLNVVMTQGKCFSLHLKSCP